MATKNENEKNVENHDGKRESEGISENVCMSPSVSDVDQNPINGTPSKCWNPFESNSVEDLRLPIITRFVKVLFLDGFVANSILYCFFFKSKPFLYTITIRNFKRV